MRLLLLGCEDHDEDEDADGAGIIVEKGGIVDWQYRRLVLSHSSPTRIHSDVHIIHHVPIHVHVHFHIHVPIHVHRVHDVITVQPSHDTETGPMSFHDGMGNLGGVEEDQGIGNGSNIKTKSRLLLLGIDP